MKFKKYEIKVTVTKDLYQLILQEATMRNGKMASLVRDCIMQYFSLRSELASSIETPGNLGENHTGKIIHTLLARTEARIDHSINLLEEKLVKMNDKLQLIISMIDRFYFDLMMYLPKLPESIISEAQARAKLRYETWIKSVISH